MSFVLQTKLSDTAPSPYGTPEMAMTPPDLTREVVRDDVYASRPRVRWHQGMETFLKVMATRQEDVSAVPEPDVTARAYGDNGFRPGQVATTSKEEAFSARKFY